MYPCFLQLPRRIATKITKSAFHPAHVFPGSGGAKMITSRFLLNSFHETLHFLLWKHAPIVKLRKVENCNPFFIQSDPSKTPAGWKTQNRWSDFAKKPFLLGNLSFLIRSRYTFSGFPEIPSTDSTKRYHFCFKCMHDFDCARNAKKPGRRFRTKSMQLPRWIFCEIFENRVSSRRGIPMRKWGN